MYGNYKYCKTGSFDDMFKNNITLYCTIAPFGLTIDHMDQYTSRLHLLAVYAPVYYKRLKENKWKWHFLHIASLPAGIASALFPAMLTLGVVGYSSLDTKFPPIVCYAAGHRNIAIYVFLLPTGVLNAVFISELILLFHFLLR